MDRDQLIRITAKLAHEKLCNEYQQGEQQSFKEIDDEKQIKKHNNSELMVSAAIAVDAVLVRDKTGKPFDDDFVEEVAEIIHQRWLERNADCCASDIEKRNYIDLPEGEKIKDRHFITSAIEAFQRISLRNIQ